MVVDLNSKPHSLTHIANMSYDEDNQLSVREIVGDDGTGTIRKAKVNSSGEVYTTTSSLPLPTGAATSANQNPADAYNTNDIEVASATVTYLGMEALDGAWYLKKIDTSSGNVFGHATITNNSLVTTYSAAWTARATLTYGDFKDAF